MMEDCQSRPRGGADWNSHPVLRGGFTDNFHVELVEALTASRSFGLINHIDHGHNLGRYRVTLDHLFGDDLECGLEFEIMGFV
ncbi:hypothetical protein [Methylobacterium aquaticum]|uniref:hypothetical protein n=1 Tax=Methylobacterium aquaticum TaxID=270351 RepID=UPI000A939EC0|nr:hypothetical protein [Methylobacterium aquaticum]